MKIDRLLGILTLLLQNEKMTAPTLAARFEVSRRTILRDIDTLCRAGVPVVTTQGGDGGIAIMQGYKINKNVLTADELQNLIAALKGIDSVSKVSRFENLMLKLAPEKSAVVSLADSMVINLASFYQDSLSEKIERIRMAIRSHTAIVFDYYYPKGETRRSLEPYMIEFRWNAWYVFGWCPEREAFRRFKLNRLWELSLTDAKFEERPVPPEQANAADAHPETQQMRIRFDKSVRFRLIEEYGLHCYEETEEALYMTLRYTNRAYTLSWVTGFGDQAEILAPQDVREAFAVMVKNMAAKYGT